MKFNPDWVVSPGETLAEWFEEMGVPKAVARQYGISERTLNGVLAGEQLIGVQLARKLERLTLVSSAFWLALEHNYRVGLAAGKKRV